MAKTLFHHFGSDRNVSPVVECNREYRLVHLWLNSEHEGTDICIECSCYWNKNAPSIYTATLHPFFSSSTLSVHQRVVGNDTLSWAIIQNILISSSVSYILHPNKRQRTGGNDQHPSIVSTVDQKCLFLLTTVNSGYCYILYPITNQSLRKKLLQQPLHTSKPLLLPAQQQTFVDKYQKTQLRSPLLEARQISTTYDDTNDWKKILFSDAENDESQLPKGDTGKPSICNTTVFATQQEQSTTMSTSTSPTPTTIEKDDIFSLPLPQFCTEWMAQDNFFLDNNPRQLHFLKKLFEAMKNPQANTADPSTDIMYIDQKTLHQYCSQQKDQQQRPHVLQTLTMQIMIRLQLLHFYGTSQIPSYFLLDWKNASTKKGKKKSILVKKSKQKEEKEDAKVLIVSAILALFAHTPFLLGPKQISLIKLVSWIFKPFGTSPSVSWIFGHVLDYFELDIPERLEEGQHSQETTTTDVDSDPKPTATATATNTVANDTTAETICKPNSTAFSRTTSHKNKPSNPPYTGLSTATVSATWRKIGKAIPNHFSSNARPIIHVPCISNHSLSAKVSMAILEKKVETKEPCMSHPTTVGSFCLTPQEVEFTPLKKGGRLASILVADAAAAARTKVPRKIGML